MSKISNVMTLLQLLSNGKKYSINELSQILEVTPRMIRVYKEELEKAGIYIDTIMGPYGGYVLKKDIHLPNRSFIKEDLEILDTVLHRTENVKEIESLRNLKDKIRNLYIVNHSIVENLNVPLKEKEKFNLLMKVIKERKKVNISYYTFDKGGTERVIYPAEMYCFQNSWYCSAYCELRQDIRHFELKRILKIKLLEENY